MFSPTKKIIIIDSCIESLQIIIRYLSDQNMDLILCSKPKKAMELIKQEMPDLILLELDMPEISGLELLEKIRNCKETSCIPVILMTDLHKKKILKQVYYIESVDCIYKPIWKEELISRIYNYFFRLEEKNILQRYVQMVEEYILLLATDTEGIILSVSKAFCKRTGFSKQEVIGRYYIDFIQREKSDSAWEDISYILNQNHSWKGKVKLKTKNTSFLWTNMVIETMFDNQKRFIGYQIIITDISDQLAWKELAIRDPLTKIYNRIKLLEWFHYEIEKASRYHHIFSIVIADIDDFKIINDTFGHNFGDRVLEEFSKILISSVRKVDIVGRWGGEEFLMILPQTKVEFSYQMAKRLRYHLSQYMVTYNHICVPMSTVSIGITEFIKGDNIHSLIDRSDRALYQSKRNGKNQITIFSL